ncbi:Uncharacterised protein [Acholeplasma oculi]|uniref:Uncharacterized protein n=1 Tax=Acholeplasma oculi TaxID=35623 RepID=A0A061AB79_9MOLU|nr:hypothetical protein [Acholeplasma oculi]CDR30654.1 hypothetical protein Aocu_05810 [Acholeplasma oculi]SKC34605.1 hypothetical protein SAMN02745122_0007 [Acholeplasma oculi]SKC45720.1 hypothetical protein SAMN02745122_1168 [Acholeplasma oculi]SUT89412.1 Uncharacterised protein [Acholeplasma oculi]
MGLLKKKVTASKRKTKTSKKPTVKKQSSYDEYNARIRVNNNTGKSELISIRKAQKKSSK